MLEIIIILLNKRSVTAKELADRFEVSTRTIYRDIDILSGAGIPVFTNQGNGGGICLLENYALDKALITEYEIESLLLALKALQVTKYPEIDRIVNKIGAVFKNASADWVDVEFLPWGSSPNESNKFLNVKKAILESKVVTFEYVNAEGNKSFRSIEPMRLIYKGQSWYLWGYCRMKEGFRIFRISRMKNLLVQEQTFKRRRVDDTKNKKCFENPKTWVNLKLRFQPQALHRIYDDYEDRLITRNEDGTFDVTISFPEDEWVYGYILSFGCYVEVLEPKHIRNIVCERMKKALRFYE